MLRKLHRLIWKCYQFREYNADAKKSVGFIGLGVMGSKLVEKLLDKGIKVTAYDLKSQNSQNMKKKGATIANSPGEVAAQNDIVFTLVPKYKAISNICDGKNGLLANAKPGTLLVDLSTIGPVNAIKLQISLKEKEIDFLCAPISGSTIDLDHNIIFLVGGDKKLLAKVESYLNIMGGRAQSFVHIGTDVSDGQAARICGILLLACTLVGASEVMNLGIRLGLNPVILKDALSLTSGRCWACQFYNPVPHVLKESPATNNYKPGQSVITYLNGLIVAVDVAAKIHSPIPLGSLACQVFNIAAVRGLGSKDIGIVYKLFKQTLVTDD